MGGEDGTAQGNAILQVQALKQMIKPFRKLSVLTLIPQAQLYNHAIKLTAEAENECRGITKIPLNTVAMQTNTFSTN